MSETVLIVAGGETPTPQVQRALPPAAMCIAADSGIDHVRTLGLEPDVVIGDLDSASDDALDWARGLGAEIRTHPPDKDQTDLELALDLAMTTNPDRIVVVGIGGGRLDHLLANFAVLAHHRYRSVDIDGLVGTALISVVTTTRLLAGTIGELISLLPMHGDATGVATEGLQYRLDDETLRGGSSRGVSNVFAATEATVSLSGGALLAIQPDRLDSNPGGP
ncbi:MAG: thiamine diphosphokinase [Actinomycetia bacterium]|nr:thiamine diphosphokinase [Actinomycetes bacterium]